MLLLLQLAAYQASCTGKSYWIMRGWGWETHMAPNLVDTLTPLAFLQHENVELHRILQLVTTFPIGLATIV